MTDITARIAEYIVATQSTDLPDKVRREALRSLFNIVGCTIGGARHGFVEIADRTLGAYAGPPHATLFGRGRRADALHATLINCLASSVFSFDDTHAEAVVHPGGPVVTAAFALAERRPVEGADFLTAIALGIELSCRLCKAVSVPPARGNFAWSGTGISGGIGAAVAAGKLLKLDATQMRRAIAVALSQAAGFRAMHGTASMPMMPAQAAQTGLRAALLAEHGFTASLTPIEGHYGFFEVFCEQPDLDAMAGGLGTRFEILKNTYKPYPCGIVIHPIIDACLWLRREHAPDPGDIVRVDIKASPGAMALCNRPHPQDEMQAQVSLHHWVAVAFIRGTARVADMDATRAVRDPALMAFQDNVTAVLDPAVAADAADVTATLRDGRRLYCRIEHGIGSADRPMTEAELERKFTDLAEPVIGAARARELVDRCWGVPSLADVGEVARAAA